MIRICGQAETEIIVHTVDHNRAPWMYHALIYIQFVGPASHLHGIVSITLP